MAVPRELDCFKAHVFFYIWYIPLLHHPIEIRPISQPSSSFKVHWQGHLVHQKLKKSRKKKASNLNGSWCNSSLMKQHFHHTKHFRKKEPCVRCKTYLSPQENASVLVIIALVWWLPSLPAVLVTGSNNIIHATHVFGTNLDPNLTYLYVFSVLAGKGKSLEKTNDWDINPSTTMRKHNV